MEGLSGGALGPSALFGTTEILRIVVEGKGSSGFVEVTSGNTLREVRKLVEEQVAAAPAHFVFLLPDGIPVSRRQERTQSVSSCLPCVTLRAVEPKTGPAKVTVDGPDGRQLALWVPSEYTFRQLRGDCAQYWRVSPPSCALCDENNCLWPDSARVLTVLLDPKFKGGSRIRFVAKNAAAGRRDPSPAEDNRRQRTATAEAGAGEAGPGRRQREAADTAATTGGADETESEGEGDRAQASAQAEAAAEQRNGGVEGARSVGWRSQGGASAHSAQRTRPRADPRAVAAAARQGVARAVQEGDADANEAELWRIFTRYASLGSAADPFRLTRRQFAQLVRDCGLIGPSLTHTDADLMYVSAVTASRGDDALAGEGSGSGARPHGASSPWRDGTSAGTRIASYGRRWQPAGPSPSSASSSSSSSGAPGSGAEGVAGSGPMYMTFAQFLDALTQLAWRSAGPRSSTSRAATEALHRALWAGTALERLPQRAAQQAERAAQAPGARGPLAALGLLLRRLGTEQSPGPVEVASVREAALREVEGIQEAAFYHLLTRYVLPKAVRWPDQTWKPPAGVAGRGTAALLRAVGPSLRDLFLAYSPAGERRESVDVTRPPPTAGDPAHDSAWEPSITFYSWLSFLQDGGISELRVARTTLAEAFLAAAQGSGLVVGVPGPAARSSRGGAGLAESVAGSDAASSVRGGDDTAASLAAEAAAQMAAARRGDASAAAEEESKEAAAEAAGRGEDGVAQVDSSLPLSTALVEEEEGAVRSEAARSPMRLTFPQFLEGLCRVAVAAYAGKGQHPPADLLPGTTAQQRTAQHWQRRGASAEAQGGGEGTDAPHFLSPREAANTEAALCGYVLALLRHVSRTYDVRGHERLAARRGVSTAETGRFLRACGGLAHRLLALSQAVEAEELADMVEGGMDLADDAPRGRDSGARSGASTARSHTRPALHSTQREAAASPRGTGPHSTAPPRAGVGARDGSRADAGDHDTFAARRAFGELARVFGAAPASAPASEDGEAAADVSGPAPGWSQGGEESGRGASVPAGTRGRSMLVKAGSRYDRAAEIDAATEAGRAAAGSGAGKDAAAPSSPRTLIAASVSDAATPGAACGATQSPQPLLRGVRRASIAGSPHHSSPAGALGTRGRRRTSAGLDARDSPMAGGAAKSSSSAADARAAADGSVATRASPAAPGRATVTAATAPAPAPASTKATTHAGDSKSAAAAMLARQRTVQEQAVARVHEQIERALAASRGMNRATVASRSPPAPARGGGQGPAAAPSTAVDSDSGVVAAAGPATSGGDSSSARRGGHRAPEEQQREVSGAGRVGAALVGDTGGGSARDSTGSSGNAGADKAGKLRGGPPRPMAELTEEEEEEEEEEEGGDKVEQKEDRVQRRDIHAAAPAPAPAPAPAASSAPLRTAGADSPSTAAAAAAAAAEDNNFRTLRDVVIKGDVFMKHGRRGNPHRRFVWYDAEMDMVQWRKLRVGVTARAERGLALSAVSHVQTGQETTVLRRGSVPAERANTLFSLVSSDRTLDLEAEDAGKRDLWVQALRAMLMRPAGARKRGQ